MRRSPEALPSPVTVTVHEADTSLSIDDVAVITAVPAATAVTSPETGCTSATSGLLLDHLTDVIVASAGVTVALSAAVFPTPSVSADLSSFTAVTGFGASFALPSCLLASCTTVTVNVLLPERMVIVASRRSPV